MESSSRAIASSTPLPPYSHALLLLPQDEDHRQASSRAPGWRGVCAAVLVAAGVLLVVATGMAGVRTVDHQAAAAAAAATEPAVATTGRGRDNGVSEKTSGVDERLGLVGGGADEEKTAAEGFPWSNAMLQWQRTGFHFQPHKNWMNDPNGPVFYRGWYHLFYQYSPEGAVWGNIAWGHAVSRDLVHWRHLPLAMVPDRWYDANGVWTGSATVLPDGRVAMLYTGSTNASVQVQCLAVPADPSDSLLRRWTKFEGNPVLYPPPGIGDRDFRDPTSAWLDPSDDTWRIVIGSKDDADHAGIAIVYKTTDFVGYELVPGLLHRVPSTGMWECIDFYPVGVTGDLAENGLDMSEAMAAVTAANRSSGSKDDDVVLHVMKASMDDDRHDYYALGRYEASTNTWTPLDPDKDLGVGIGLRYDWGKFYASKTFYDPAKRRRVLWGWVGETDSERADVAKGWASLQSIPRTVLLDTKTGTNLLQWPVEEVETLRINSTDFSGVSVAPGSVVPLSLRRATQLDILAEFEIDSQLIHDDDVADHDDAGSSYECSTGGGAAGRGALGPFGLLVLADTRRGGEGERTAVYLYVSKQHKQGGRLRAHLCHDESRSSRANDIAKRVVGGAVAVVEGESSLSVRVLVDHSIVESFGMGGRSVVTSRVYPTEAIYGAAGVYLFNNATAGSVTARKLVVHEMDSSYNQAVMAED